jgi:hypothetical protein
VVLVESDLLYRVEDSKPVFDGKQGRWEDLEGWYVIAPGNVRKYLAWLVDQKSRGEREDVPE